MGGININNFRYADDTVLLAESEEGLQVIMDEVNESGKKYNMKMNAKKTKTMIITKKDVKPEIKTTIETETVKFSRLLMTRTCLRVPEQVTLICQDRTIPSQTTTTLTIQ